MQLPLLSRVLLLVLPLALTTGASGQDERFVGEPIHYEAAGEEGPVERLLQQLERGELELRRDPRTGYLPALLEALDIPVSSQTLVFSKTSFQLSLISPTRPRAVYFGDEVYIGAVPGAPVLEITSIDPRRGPLFYTLAQGAGARPLPVRRDAECLQCHASTRTGSWPANLVRSVHPDANGHPILRSGAFYVGHETPIENRWGGWYVTGTHGDVQHMGNVVVPDGSDMVDRSLGANVVDLSDRVDTFRHLSPHSDIVALMVLEHQAEMHNRITRGGYEVRLALHREEESNRFLDIAPGTERDSTRRIIERQAGDIVAYLLFRDEVRLEAPVSGTSSFREEFEARGPRDERGRSLRDLSLRRHLFRYSCSYVIYSPAFDALPEILLEAVYRELWKVLTDESARDEYPRISQRDGDAVREILLATKAGLPKYWE